METHDIISVADRSYKRCIAHGDFLHRFYELLLASDPRIPPMFAETQFERQTKLVQHALGLLLIYARRPNPALLERLADRHGREDLDIGSEYYPLFLDCLVGAVKEHDPEYTDEIGEAWRQAMQPGIDYMISKYV